MFRKLDPQDEPALRIGDLCALRDPPARFVEPESECEALSI